MIKWNLLRCAKSEGGFGTKFQKFVPKRKVIKWSLCSSVCLQFLTNKVCLGPLIKKEWNGSTPPLDREEDMDCQWIPGEGLRSKIKKNKIKGFGKSHGFAWDVYRFGVWKQWKSMNSLSKTMTFMKNVWFSLGFHRFFIVFRLKINTRLKQNHDFCQIPWFLIFLFCFGALLLGSIGSPCPSQNANIPLRL